MNTITASRPGNRWRLTPERKLWRTAIHEAAHYALAEWLGIAAPTGASIRPEGPDSLGRYTDNNLFITWSDESVRMRIMVLVAGRAAERVIDGAKGWLDGTDFIHAYKLRDKLPEAERASAISEATAEVEHAIKNVLWVQILTVATFLLEHGELDGGALRDIWWSALPNPQWRPQTPRGAEELKLLKRRDAK